MNKSVLILTSFSDIQKAYSLNIIVQTQIKQLLLNGYTPTIIVHEGFKPEGIYAHPNLKVEYIPNVPVHNEVRKDETFDQDVEALEAKIFQILSDNKVEIVMSHDLIYQNALLKHNIACRRVAKRLPDVKWLHWIHSATSPLMLNQVRPIFSDEYVNVLQDKFPNSKYVYPNTYAVPSVAKNFNISQEDVRVVHHPTDIASLFNMPQDLERFVYKKNILSADAITTYPARLDTGKQVQYVIKTMAMLRDFGLTVRIIVADFHSTGGDKVTYRERLKEVGIDYGLNSDELTFLSEENEAWKYEVPQNYISSLQMLSNVFIMPSVSETYSLVTQEAALCKQVLVLNYDFPPFRSIYGENAIYRKYSSGFDVLADLEQALTAGSGTNTQYGPGNLPEEARKQAEKNYHKDTAGMIAARLKHPEMALSIYLRKNRNLQEVFKKEIEILFYE